LLAEEIVNTKLLVICSAFAALTAAAQLAKPEGPQTLRNLQSAYNGESNARVRYLAFALQADKEGEGPVGSLFRAAARAEEIHFTNHAVVIRSMGGVPGAKIEKPVVLSTQKNLDGAASKGEAYERDTMYPGFIKTARAESNPAAVETFEYARKAEAQHFNLFAGAAKDATMKQGGKRPYYVCKVSGYTAATADPSQCVGSVYETIQ
jgi:rubrerythrin